MYSKLITVEIYSTLLNLTKRHVISCHTSLCANQETQAPIFISQTGAVCVDMRYRRPRGDATLRAPSIGVHKPTLEIELANYPADRPAAPLPPNPISANKWRLILICVRGGGGGRWGGGDEETVVARPGR